MTNPSSIPSSEPALNLITRRAPIVRVGSVILGSLLVLTGLAGWILPVLPGWLFMIPGLALLAGEFMWAQNLLDRANAAKEKAISVTRR